MVEANANNLVIAALSVISDGNGGFTPCPDVLTAEEAIRYLRLDTLGVRDPRNTLRNYREQGLIKATKIGRKNFYRKQDLDEFVGTMFNLTQERRQRCGPN